MFAVGICFVRQERGENRLEAKYFRDYKHNYMILQCGQEATVRSYQYKILTSDKIKEILRCSVRHINGTTYYYYDISSRTTLKSLYQSSRMSYEQVKDLLCQLHGIYASLAGFFLEESGLVLLPEHICQRRIKNVRKRRLFFVVFRRSHVTFSSVSLLKKCVYDLLLLTHEFLAFFQPV